MRMRVLWIVPLFVALVGCTAAKPIITPQEYQSSCRQAVGADATCQSRVCDSFQETVTDYFDTKQDCFAACKAKAENLASGGAGACLDKVDSARAACMEYCQRKFYRCNCDKIYTPGVGTN
jgi:hypothetical protein